MQLNGERSHWYIAVGRYGAGKSTLIHSMLRREEDTPHAQNEIRVYAIMVGDVEVKFINTHLVLEDRMIQISKY